MDKRFSLDGIVRSSYRFSLSVITQVNVEITPMEYKLDIVGGDYPQDLDPRHMVCLGTNGTSELITNAVKNIFSIGDLEELFNGFDASPYKSRVPKINVSLKESHGKYLIEVEDNGPGIYSEDIPNIWTPGFSRRGTGGIGLAVLQGGIESNYGGRVVVESIPNVSTKFSIHLPKSSFLNHTPPIKS